jgi:nucleotide-binding universal stress UspA family protein
VSQEREAPIVRRILVALDASPHSLAALEAALSMALRFQAELSGLYIEDVDLLRLAGLPFAREIGHHSAQVRQLNIVELEQQIRGQTLRVRRIFARTTGRSSVRHSFNVSRGSVLREISRAASEADMLVLGRAGWSLLRPGRMGRTARAIVREGPDLALILERDTCLGPPLVVVYDGSELAQKALAIALAMLLEEEQSLLVLLLADGHERIQPLQSEVERALQEGIEVRYRSLTGSTVERIARAIEEEGCGTLVLPARSVVLEDTAVQELMDEIQVPTLLVR